MNFIALFGNIWFRRAALAVAILIAALAIRQHYINVGKDQGKQDAVAENAKALNEARESDRKKTESDLADKQRQIDALIQQAATDRNLFLALVSQRQAVAQQVASMTPAQVDERINAYLGRKPADSTPYTEEDKKKLAQCTTQLPLCERQVETKSAEADKLNAQVSLKNQQYDSLSGYTTRLEANYVRLWNSTAPKERSWKCFKLWHCGRPQIKQADPLLLERPGKSE